MSELLATEPVDWSAFEAAIIEWLEEVSLIVKEGRTVFEQQTVPQPKYPYASIGYLAIRKEGGRDEIRTTTDLTRVAGKEIAIVSTAPLQVSLAVSFHVDADTLAELGPNHSATAMAMRAQASLGQLTVIEHLHAANIAIVREQGVRNTSLVVNGNWLGRATLDVLLRTTGVATEYAGFLEKVQLVNDDLGIDITLDSTE